MNEEALLELGLPPDTINAIIERAELMRGTTLDEEGFIRQAKNLSFTCGILIGIVYTLWLLPRTVSKHFESHRVLLRLRLRRGLWQWVEKMCPCRRYTSSIIRHH